MDRPGEAAEKAVGQVWTGTHRVFRSGVLRSQRRPTAARDHKVMFNRWPEPKLQPCLKETFNTLSWNNFLVWIILIKSEFRIGFCQAKTKVMMYKVYNRSDARCQCCSSGFILGIISVLEKKCNPVVSLCSSPLCPADISIISSWKRMFWRGGSRAPSNKLFA